MKSPLSADDTSNALFDFLRVCTRKLIPYRSYDSHVFPNASILWYGRQASSPQKAHGGKTSTTILSASPMWTQLKQKSALLYDSKLQSGRDDINALWIILVVGRPM
jgi:predicted glutamine amidotransferase